jgi:hypothetical protein
VLMHQQTQFELVIDDDGVHKLPRRKLTRVKLIVANRVRNMALQDCSFALCRGRLQRPWSIPLA